MHGPAMCRCMLQVAVNHLLQGQAHEAATQTHVGQISHVGDGDHGSGAHVVYLDLDGKFDPLRLLQVRGAGWCDREV